MSGEPFPPPGDLPDPRIEPVSPASAGGFFTRAAWETVNLLLKIEQSVSPNMRTLNSHLQWDSIRRGGLWKVIRL